LDTTFLPYWVLGALKSQFKTLREWVLNHHIELAPLDKKDYHLFWQKAFQTTDMELSVLHYFYLVGECRDNSCVIVESFNSWMTKIFRDKSRKKGYKDWPENSLRLRANGPPPYTEGANQPLQKGFDATHHIDTWKLTFGHHTVANQDETDKRDQEYQGSAKQATQKKADAKRADHKKVQQKNAALLRKRKTVETDGGIFNPDLHHRKPKKKKKMPLRNKLAKSDEDEGDDNEGDGKEDDEGAEGDEDEDMGDDAADDEDNSATQIAEESSEDEDMGEETTDQAFAKAQQAWIDAWVKENGSTKHGTTFANAYDRWYSNWLSKQPKTTRTRTAAGGGGKS
jgi:hypothetical protein